MPFDHRNKDPLRLERTLAIVALIFIGIAWIMGTFRAESTLLLFLNQALPEANHFEHTGGEPYSAWKEQKKEQLMGYVTAGSAHGYGGEIRMAVAVSIDGTVMGLTIIDHKETTSFLRRVLKRDFLETLQGKIYSDPFILGQDVDNVTGATYTCRAIADAVRKATRRVASRDLDFPVIPEPTPPIQFGLPEAVLVALFAVGFVGRWDRFKYRKTARWTSMLTGLFVLGFVYDKPLTLTMINKMLLGFWPEWQLHLYWYSLLAGILFVFTADNKNPYCEWFCPFGAAQECLGIIGGAKVRTPQRYRSFLRWFQRALALSAIIIALLYRNPSISCYEVFGAFFRLIGSNFHFVLLGVVLIAALFLQRPWCRYLCPLKPVVDYFRLMRNWVKEIWLKLRSNPAKELIEIKRDSQNRGL